MARIEHRRTVRGNPAAARSLRALPVVAIAFLVLAVVVAALELADVASAWWSGVTDWWGTAPPLLPSAARAAAMVALPAAVAWGSPGRHRANAWLWKGALLIAVVQLLQYPADAVRSWLFETIVGDGSIDATFQLASVAISLPLAVGSIIGIWALSEGLGDAGARSAGVVPVALVVTLVFALLLVIPTFMSGLALDLDGVLLVFSLVFNCAFVFVEGLLVGRAVAGAMGNGRPRQAWVAGSIGAATIWVGPLISWALLLGNSLLTPGADPFVIPFFGLTPLFGWPVVALALAAGMGRVRASVSTNPGPTFVVRGTPRVEGVSVAHGA